MRLEAEGAVLALGPNHLAALCGEQVSFAHRVCLLMMRVLLHGCLPILRADGATARKVTLYRLLRDGAMMCAMLPTPPGRLTDVKLNDDTIAFLAEGAQSSRCLPENSFRTAQQSKRHTVLARFLR